jgi:hypothetical protein
MNLSSKHIILIILAIIIFTFVYNYDVYIVEKSQPICKPIYVTKRVLSPDAEELLEENGVPKLTEGMGLIDNEIIEGFNTIMGQSGNFQSSENTSNLNIPGISLSSFTVAGVSDTKKIKVMDSVIKVLSNIPTNLDINSIKQMVEYFGMIYQTSSSLANFYQNVSSSTKIKDAPYNSKYSQLVLYLIGKFNNDVENCIERPKNECGLIINPENEQEKKQETEQEKKQRSKQEKKQEAEQEKKQKQKPEQCETCNIKPEIIKKITSEIVHDVTNEITNEIVHDVTNEIKNIYPKPEYQYPEYLRPSQPTQEHFNNNNNNNNNNNGGSASIISEIINRILPEKSCPSTKCSSPTYVTCPSCPTLPPNYPSGPSGPYNESEQERQYPTRPNYPSGPSGPYNESEQERQYPTRPNYPSRPSGPYNESEQERQYPSRPNYPSGPYNESEQERYYPTRPGYPGSLPEQRNPFNNFPGEFNPRPQRNIQNNKPCTDKCSVQCPIQKPDYLAAPEPFGLIQSYDEGTDFYPF